MRARFSGALCASLVALLAAFGAGAIAQEKFDKPVIAKQR